MKGKAVLRRVLPQAGKALPTALQPLFRLREGVNWHDGKPFTSADVAFSAMEVWKPLQNLGRVVFKSLEKVETPDEHTAIFHFSEPTPFQLIRNALPALTAVLPKHVFAGTDIAANPANESSPARGRSNMQNTRRANIIGW